MMSKEFVGKDSVSESFIYDEDESLLELERDLMLGENSTNTIIEIGVYCMSDNYD